MFQRGRQASYSGTDSTSEQHILTVMRFHEVRLGKIEKHLINTNKQLERLITQKKQNPIRVSAKTTNNTESFTILKNMMTNLTEQVAVSQSFMKEIKEVISNLKHSKVEEKVEEKVEKKVEEEEDEEEDEEEKVELNSSSIDDHTNSKLLELERNIAIVSIIGIGMDPTANRIDEYIERNRRDRKRILNHLEASSVNKKVTNSMTEEAVESKEEGKDVELMSHEPHPIVDDTVLENDIIKLTNFKSHVEEEVQEVLDKIPVIIKPRKKRRRGRPKKA